MGVAEADPAEIRGRLLSVGKRAKPALIDSAGVVTMACTKRKTVATREALRRGRAHGQPALREQPSRALQGGGGARTTDDAG
jgi:hypothetical protein